MGELVTIQAVAQLITAGLTAGTLAVEEIASAVEAIYQRIFGAPPTPAQSEAILQTDLVQLATLQAREAAQGGTANS
jgi:hypothetical protein